MKALTLVAAFLFASAAGATDIHGVELNSRPTIAELRAQLGINVADGHYLAAGAYSGSLKIAGCPVITKVKADADGRIARMTIEFPPSCFDDMASIAIKKWGQPTKSGEFKLANAYGATVDAREHDWSTADGALVALVNVDPVLSQNLSVLMGTLTVSSRP